MTAQKLRSVQPFVNQMKFPVQVEWMKMDARNQMFVLNKKEITMEICVHLIVLEFVMKIKYYVKVTLMTEVVAHLTHVRQEARRQKETILEDSALVIVLQIVNTMNYYAPAKRIAMVV